MASPHQRLARVLEVLDAEIDVLPTRWRLFAACGADAELALVRLLKLRTVVLGKPALDWRGWCARRYPDVPSAVRCVATAVRLRMEAQGTFTDDAYTTALGRELSVMARDLRAAADAAEPVD